MTDSGFPDGSGLSRRAAIVRGAKLAAGLGLLLGTPRSASATGMCTVSNALYYRTCDWTPVTPSSALSKLGKRIVRDWSPYVGGDIKQINHWDDHYERHRGGAWSWRYKQTHANNALAREKAERFLVKRAIRIAYAGAKDRDPDEGGLVADERLLIGGDRIEPEAPERPVRPGAAHDEHNSEARHHD